MEENRYRILLYNRNELRLDGIRRVLSFLETEASVVSALGLLQITGKEMHLEKLDLDSGEMIVTGRIDSLYYPDESAEEGRGLLSRLFRGGAG